MPATTVELDLTFNAPQLEAYQAISKRQTVFYGWGRGVGKSWFVRCAWYLLIAQWEGKLRPNCPKRLKGVRILVLMPTLVQFKDVHWAEIENELTGDGDWAWLGAKLDRQRGQISFPGGSSIKPFPAAAYNARTARGMRCDVLSGDEIDDIETDVYHSVAIPWLSEPWSLGIQLLGGTPTRGHHGLWYSLLKSGRLGAKIRAGSIPEADALATHSAVDIRGVLSGIAANKWPSSLPLDKDAATLQILASFHAFHATYKDAPETVDPVAVANARATMSEAAFNREWLADPDAGEGLVYPFDEEFHVRAPPSGMPFAEEFIGLDHGYNDPGVFAHCALIGHGEDSIFWIVDETYETEKPNGWWNDKARAHVAQGRKTFYCDPSRPDRITDLCELGAHAVGADNDILAGVARVADLMFIRTGDDGKRRCRFYVAPHCVNTIRELGSYRRKRRPDGTFDEKPEDKNNHAMDSIRYAAVMRFGRLRRGKHVAPGR